MKPLLLFALSVFLLSPVVARAGDDLQLTITLTRGEHSKDSSETVRKVIINGQDAVFEISYSGRPNPANQPVRKSVSLTADEIKGIKKLLDQRRIQGTEKRNFGGPDTVNYFSITITKGSGSKEASLLIMGMPLHPMVRGDAAFRYADQLIVELFRILHEHDPEIVYVSVVD